MTTRRKVRERFFLDRFLKEAGIEAEVQHEGEAPDFVICCAGRSAGVEVREVFIEPSAHAMPLRALESITDRIVARAREIYEKGGRRPLFVSVSFFDAQVSQHLRRDDAAAALASLIVQLTWNRDGPSYWRNDYADSTLSVFATVSVFPESAASEGRWCVNRSGWVWPLMPSDLALSVAEKNLKYERYRKLVPEVWLLLAIDSSAPSQLFDVDQSLDLSGLGSKFDRTYFLRTAPPLLVGHQRDR